MKPFTTLPASAMVAVGLLCASSFAMGEMADCLKDLDPEKELGIKFDKVVTGSDGPPGPPSAEEVTSRALVGTLTIINRTSKRMNIWVSSNMTFSSDEMRLYSIGLNYPVTLAVADPSGNTYLKACPPPSQGNGSCYYKTLNDTLRYTYLWIIQ
jgi:hypothetical protein